MKDLNSNMKENLSRAFLTAQAAGKVVNVDSLSKPLRLVEVELLRAGNAYFVRVRDDNGDFGLAPAKSQLGNVLNFFAWAAEFFVGRDARDIDALSEDVYFHARHYKYAGLPFWLAAASVEVAVLDLLGRAANLAVAQLLGGWRRREIPVYLSSMARHTTPEEEVDKLATRIGETGVQAVKFKIGGRMSRNADASPERSERLVALARRRLGDAITLYADANGSYDVEHAVEIGRMLESHGVAFFEEPCPWEEFEQTREVNQALDMPVAGGEQDASLPRFNWMLRKRAVSVVQPDLYYVGGFVRLARVARMATAAGVPLTQHSSCAGALAAGMLHFAAAFDNLGGFQEYRIDEPDEPWCSPAIRVKQGKVQVPEGSGLGLAVDAAFLGRAERLAGARR